MKFTSLVAVAGIAVGLASLTVAQALADGFARGVREKLLVNTGHVTVTSKGELSVSPRLVESKIASVKGVTRVDPTAFEPAGLLADGVMSYAVIRTVPDSDPALSKAGVDTVEVPVLVGAQMFSEARGKLPVTAAIVLADNAGGQITKAVRIAGTFETGLFEYDSTWIFLRRSDLALLKGEREFVPEAYSVYVRDLYEAPAVADGIRAKLGSGFEVVDWQEANKPLFSALALERQIALWVVFLIILVSVLSITTTLALLVKDRLQDIAVLKTLGANTRLLSAVFLFEGWILSIAGIVIGVSLGLVFCSAANRFRLISLPQEVYSLNEVTLSPDGLTVLISSAVVFAVSTLAIAVPVIRAATVKPFEILRLK